MYFSAKGEYGIMAVLDLALANGSAPVQAKIIADRQGIPLPCLEHLLSALKPAGPLARSVGAHGGSSLAKLSRESRTGEVIRVLAGPIGWPARVPPRPPNGSGRR